MSRDLKSTLVMLQPLQGDDVLCALQVLGRLSTNLIESAHDAGFRLRLIVMADGAANRSNP